MIEQSLYEHLIGQAELGSILASYNGDFAVFNQEAPTDIDEAWSSPQYPRIVFAVTMQDDPERGTSGNLYVDVMSSKEEGLPPPEEIEPVVRPLIDGYFFKASDGGYMAAQWDNTAYFTEANKKVAGATLTFSLRAFPVQASDEPDPVALMNEWTKKEFPTAHIIGLVTEDSPAWRPTDEAPAIYWRLVDTRSAEWIPDTYATSWFTASIRGHIMAPSYEIVNALLRYIDHTLTYSKRLIFPDQSPLMVDRNIRVQHGADALKTGQITIEGTYGVLTPRQEVNPLMHINKKLEGGA